MLAALLLACSLDFDAPRVVPNNSVALVADFDRDGKPELLTAAALPDDGTVAHAAAGDLDGDGALDVVTQQWLPEGTTIFVNRNAGNGRFAPRLPLHRSEGTFLVGDFLTGGADEVFTFVAIVSLDGRTVVPAFAGPYFNVLAAGDFNGDGHLDLAGTDAGDHAIFVAGDGTGRFSNAVAVRAGPSIRDVVAADFDGDGRDDAAVSNYAGDSVSIILDPLRGVASTFAVRDGPGQLLAADFDGDGDRDLAVQELADGAFDGTNGAPTVAIFRNDGRGGFVLADRFFAGAPQGTADFDGDGHLDLVVESAYLSSATVHGNGDGTFRTSRSLPSFGSFPELHDVADLDGDGIDELLLRTTPFPYQVTVGWFGKGVELLPPLPETVTEMTAGDLTDDPGLEIAAVSWSRVTVFARESGHWVPRQLFPFAQAIQAVIRDFTGDGRGDLAVLHHTGSRTLVRIMSRDGVMIDEVPVEGGMIATTILALDADGDGDSDLLVSGTGTRAAPSGGTKPDGYVAIRFNDGRGHFSEETRILRDEPLSSPVAGDFNGDGADDVAISTAPSGAGPARIFRILSHHDGTFAAPQPLELTGFHSPRIELTAGDIDGDGGDELVGLLRAGDVIVYDGESTTPRGTYLASSAAGLAVVRASRSRASILVPLQRSGEMRLIEPRCAPRRRRAV